MVKWFHEDRGEVAIYDATNTTRERRDRVVKKCRESGIEVMFIESICHDPDVIIHNIAEVKLSGPDYAGTQLGMDPEAATEDFKERMRHYEKAYETIAEDTLSFVKLINVGSLVIVNLIKGWMQSRIVYFLMNLHTQPRRILFSRHGESMYNLRGLLGGDSDLSPRGQLYAQSLPSVIRRALGPEDAHLTVWTSTLKRTKQTSAYLPFPKMAWKALDELDAGVCDGMTYEEIEAKYPEDYMERDADKYRYRYRGGESYFDLVTRLEPIIMELERQRNILIIGHQAVLRCLYAYFMKIPVDELPYIKIPLHTVISITPRAHGCDEERYSLDIPAVDTHRDPRRGSASVAAAVGVTTPPVTVGSTDLQTTFPPPPPARTADEVRTAAQQPLGDSPTASAMAALAASYMANAPAAAPAGSRVAAVADTPSPTVSISPGMPGGIPIHMSARGTTQYGPFPPSPATPRPAGSPASTSFSALGGTPVSGAPSSVDIDGIKVTLVEPEPVNEKPSETDEGGAIEEAEQIIGGEPME